MFTRKLLIFIPFLVIILLNGCSNPKENQVSVPTPKVSKEHAVFQTPVLMDLYEHEEKLISLYVREDNIMFRTSKKHPQPFEFGKVYSKGANKIMVHMGQINAWTNMHFVKDSATKYVGIDDDKKYKLIIKPYTGNLIPKKKVPEIPQVQTMGGSLEERCQYGDTVSCFEFGWATQKKGNDYMHRTIARSAFKKACEGMAEPGTASMRAKNLGCKYYKLLDY